MSRPQENIPYDPNLEAPQGLMNDLKTLYGPQSAIPPAVDEAVLARARREMVRRRRRRLALRWARPPAAAAALILWFVASPFSTPDVAPRSMEVAAQDIDGNGRLDILDALALARNIQTDRTADQPWDFNGDGVIDRHDVDTVAQSAVSLDKGESS